MPHSPLCCHWKSSCFTWCLLNTRYFQRFPVCNTRYQEQAKKKLPSQTVHPHNSQSEVPPALSVSLGSSQKLHHLSFSHSPKCRFSRPYYLWISLSASLRGAVWWQRTVNLKYQRPLDRICTLPPWIRLRLWFIVVTSFYFHVIGSGWSHCFVKPASSFPRVALVAFRLVKDW